MSAERADACRRFDPRMLVCVIALVACALVWTSTALAADPLDETVISTLPEADSYSLKGPAEVSAAGISSGVLLGQYGFERPLVTGAGDQHWPSIYGKLVAFEDRGADGDVKLYNMATNAVTNVAVRAGSHQFRPRIWGNRIVWMDDRNGNWDIYWYDIAQKKEFRLQPSVAGWDALAHQQWPEISGDRVVWEDHSWGPTEVVVYNFATGKTTRVTTDSWAQWAPKISADKLVWADQRNGNWDIFWYDLTKKVEKTLGEFSADEYLPVIWGNHVAWVITNSTEDVIMMPYVDADRSSVRYIWVHPGAQHTPRIHGDTLVWVSDESGTPQVEMTHFGGPTFTKFKIANNAGAKWAPEFWGDTLVWHDDRNGTADVHAMSLPSPKISISVPGSVSYGKATTVSGYLTSWDGIRLANRAVAVQYQRLAAATYPPWEWTALTVQTNSSGRFTASIPAQPDKFLVRAYYPGSSDAFIKTSERKTVMPKVYLGKPSGPTSIAEDKAFTVRGSLKPKHTAGTKPVRIQLYKKSGDTYVYKTSYTASVYDYDTYSRYTASIKLTSPGKWRYRAYYPTSSTNYKTYSDFRYVTAY